MNIPFQEILRQHIARYPLMRPQDCVKLAYQSEFGPAHLHTDSEQFLLSLREEWRAVVKDGSPHPPEMIGNGLCRLYLTGEFDPETAAPVLAKLVSLTAQHNEGRQDCFLDKLELLEKLDIPGMSAYLSEYRRQGYPSVGHSEHYRRAYQPHYRLLKKAFGGYFPALARIAELFHRGAAIIAIDGRCGSGKTEFAALIQQIFPCNVFHMDDFYLPLTQRAPDWSNTIGGNMDFARFLQEVLVPAGCGEGIRYRPFDCGAGCVKEPVYFPPQRLTIVEGSYSQHPLLTARYDLKIFLTCSKKEQRSRLQKREGTAFRSFEQRWIPMEEAYIQQCDPVGSCDLVIDTSGFFDM